MFLEYDHQVQLVDETLFLDAEKTYIATHTDVEQ